MRGRKNDFSITFYNGDTRRLHLHFVHDTDRALKWAARKGIPWTHANVYNRRSRLFIKRLYPNG